MIKFNLSIRFFLKLFFKLKKIIKSKLVQIEKQNKTNPYMPKDADAIDILLYEFVKFSLLTGMLVSFYYAF